MRIIIPTNKSFEYVTYEKLWYHLIYHLLLVLRAVDYVQEEERIINKTLIWLQKITFFIWFPFGGARIVGNVGITLIYWQKIDRDNRLGKHHPLTICINIQYFHPSQRCISSNKTDNHPSHLSSSKQLNNSPAAFRCSIFLFI